MGEETTEATVGMMIDGGDCDDGVDEGYAWTDLTTTSSTTTSMVTTTTTATMAMVTTTVFHRAHGVIDCYCADSDSDSEACGDGNGGGNGAAMVGTAMVAPMTATTT